MIGVSVKSSIGIGDGVQFSSVAENYFKTKNEKLVDISKPWFFDFNPYVYRLEPGERPPSRVIELWNFGPKQYQWPILRHQHVYTCNAEIFAAVLNVPVRLNRPRLYRFEEYPFFKRNDILLQTLGRSHGELPAHVIYHVVSKYAHTGKLFHIGPYGTIKPHIPHIETKDIWSLAEVISKARMIIGPDSGPSWIGMCYPDVVVKRVRTRQTIEELAGWLPLAVDNFHSHWDDRAAMVFNVSEEDVGFTSTYKKL